jgi:acyl-coenzyme A thioesterase PaaI-like protein
LVLPGGANITTAAGDSLIVIPGATLGTADKWIVVAYQSATVAPSVGGFSFRNRLMNAQGLIRQRGYFSGTATTSANQYTLDRWRVVVSGQNLSFTTTNNETTFTAPAGGVEQVIEGLNLESGTYVLNWEGTATATVGGTAVAKGGTVTVVGGTNTTVRFIGGTFIRPQFEAGSVATPFERRPYGAELALCQRYYEKRSVYFDGGSVSGTFTTSVLYKVTKRAAPTVTAAQSLNTIDSVTVEDARIFRASSNGTINTSVIVDSEL